VTASETEYDNSTRCHLDRTIQAPGTPEESVTELDYDCNGNLSAQWDANHDSGVDPPTTSYTYDALDRLETVSQPWAGGGFVVTTYAYDVQDHLTGVTDAEGNTTTYTYSDRDLLTQEASPVSGTTTHTYDEHGELDTTQDARGITVDRTVDALDRVTFVDYPDNALDTTYIYDTAPVACGGTSFPVGRLGSITRNGTSIDHCYDRFGRQTLDGELVYAWDANGNRTGIAYPGGVSATYGFDFADRETSLTVTTPGGVENAVTAATYLPSGPLSSLALGSGTIETRAFDRRYAPTSIGISGDPMGVGDRTWSYTTDRVGNILSIVETAGGACAGTLVLENQTVTTTETFTSCADLQAGNGFAVESPGDVRFEAVGKIVLTDGFSVGSGASFVAATLDEIPPLSTRTYGYQAPQYFLILADGPWGTLDWTYDRIGNRLSEMRNGGNPDSYVYATNGTGNTPILDQVTLGVGGTRDYTWGAAGHLENVDAAGNVIDFQNDAAGRLSGVSRAIASESASFAYDGRSYLTSAAATAGGTESVTPLYDSAGLLHALRRKDTSASPEELIVHLYLAGRPVAQVAIDTDTSTETWTYLTTDHLGTPILATDDAGAVVWEGGFEPFGTDYQAGTAAGARDNGIYLRLPGQWEEETWSEATSGAGVYYNVHRWLIPGVGRYTRPDPIHLGLLESSSRPHGLPVDSLGAYYLAMLRAGNPVHEQPYLYGVQNPLLFQDPLGLFGPGSLATAGGACAVVDGPLPIGDAIGVGLLITAGVWATGQAIADWWDSDEDCRECKPDPCDAQYAADSATCRGLSTARLRALCWRKAAERYGACIAGQPVPNLFPLE
jgi:YD repeat-containing protein